MSMFTDFLLIDLVGLVTAFFVIIIAYYKWNFQYWKRRNVSYLEPWIPYGNLQSALRRTRSVGEDIATFYHKLKLKGVKYGGIFLLAQPSFLAIDLDLVKLIMTKDFNHFVDRGVYVNERDDPLTAHLFAIGGVKWRNLRTKLTPTFTSGKMKAMFQTLVDCGRALEKHMMETASKGPVDIKDILGCFSTDIIGSCAFGLNCNSFQEPDSPFRRHTKKFLAPSKIQSLKIGFLQNFQSLSRLLRMRMFSVEMSAFFKKVVEDTVNYRQKNSVARKDFLQLLIDIKDNEEGDERVHVGDGKSLTMEEMVAQCFVFFIAGFETSSTTMTFALFELAINPDIQEKVRKEIFEVLGKHNNEMTYDSLSELKYLRQVIDETLRKYPPVPFVSRVCVEDYKIPGENVVIEKGTKIIIPIQGIHYDEDYYKHPKVFDPERFTEENKEARHHYSHLPFGEGPRICIGLRFGVMQTKVGLTSLLRNFKVTLNEKTKMPLKMSRTSFISTADGGIWLNFEKLK